MKLYYALAILMVMALPAAATVVTPPALIDGNGNVVPQYYNGSTWVLDTGVITAVGSITATVTTDTHGSIAVGTTWQNDSGVRTITGTVTVREANNDTDVAVSNWPAVQLVADTPYTSYGIDTSAGGQTTDTIALSSMYSLWMITCEDSCYVDIVGTRAGADFRQQALFVDRCLVLPIQASALYVQSDVAYTYPRGIKCIGLR